jgi:phage-related protein (TIGR01555 family)
VKLVNQYGRPFPPREEVAPPTHYRADRWSNEATGIGTGSDKTVQGAFRPVWRILDQELTSLHSGADIAAKIVDSVPQEAFRRGYELKCEDLNAKQIKLLREYGTDQLAVETNMLECWRWGRLYGGALLLLNVDDGGFPWEPLDETKIRSFDSISLVDRRYAFVQSQYSSLNRGKYGTPEIYLISNAVACSGWNSYTDRVRPKSGGELIREGAQASLVHESRTIRFDGNLADVVTRQQLAGWNWSVLQRVYNAMRQFEHAFDSAGYLLSDASQGVFKLQGLIKAIAMGQRGAFADRMALMEFTRSVMHGIVLDAGDEKNKPEDFVRQPTSFAGIPDLLDKMMLRLSIAAEMPATELFGRAPAGMNATGESDTRGWYSKIASKQETDVGPKLRRIYRLIALAKRGPLKGKDVSPGIHFHPLWSPTDQETAATLYTNAQRDALNITNGVVKPEEVAVGLKDIYPALNVKAREEVLNTMETFDPYSGDPEEPNAGAPVGPSGAAGVNAANQGEPAGGPMVPVPLFGGGGSPAKNAKAGTAVTQGGPSNLRTRPAPVTGPKMAKGTEPSGPAAPPDKAARAAEAAVAAGERLPKKGDHADAWDPEQARDEHGMWTAEGATSASHEAAKRSAEASGSNEAGAHQSAAMMHATAASGHRELAARHERLGNAAAAAEHAAKAAEHEKASVVHQAKAAELAPKGPGYAALAETAKNASLKAYADKTAASHRSAEAAHASAHEADPTKSHDYSRDKHAASARAAEKRERATPTATTGRGALTEAQFSAVDDKINAAVRAAPKGTPEHAAAVATSAKWESILAAPQQRWEDRQARLLKIGEFARSEGLHKDDHADQNATAVAVWQQLRPDYPEEAIAWVLDYEWAGPEDIPLKSIDDSGAAKWAASREPISVAFHTIKIGEGTKKPIVLVRVEGEKLENVADGHHRFLAYKTLGQPVSAYCVVVPKSEKRWQPMHDAQGTGSQQKSAQVGPVESADGVLGLDALKARSDARYEAWAALTEDTGRGPHVVEQWHPNGTKTVTEHATKKAAHEQGMAIRRAGGTAFAHSVADYKKFQDPSYKSVAEGGASTSVVPNRATGGGEPGRVPAGSTEGGQFAAKGDAFDPGQPRTATGQLTAHTATSLAQKATDASAKAVDAPTHHEAAAAHAFAGGMFRALSAKATKLGNTAAAARHLASAEGHDAKATEHVMAAGMGATDEPETDESANVGAETTGAATADGGGAPV